MLPAAARVLLHGGHGGAVGPAFSTAIAAVAGLLLLVAAAEYFGLLEAVRGVLAAGDEPGTGDDE